jgi:transcriptional regulator with XRE-family HTH domain
VLIRGFFVLPRATLESVSYGTPDSTDTCRHVPLHNSNCRTTDAKLTDESMVQACAKGGVVVNEKMRYYLPMKKLTPSQVLAANLSWLKRHGDADIPQGARAFAAFSGLGEGTVVRARNGSTNVNLDVLERLARAYKLEAWRLLVLGGAKALPVGADLGALQSVDVEPTLETDEMQLPQQAIDVATAWLALPENERNEFKRMIETAAQPHREPVTHRAPVSAGRDPDRPTTQRGAARPIKAVLHTVKKATKRVDGR